MVKSIQTPAITLDIISILQGSDFLTFFMYGLLYEKNPVLQA